MEKTRLTPEQQKLFQEARTKKGWEVSQLADKIGRPGNGNTEQLIEDIETKQGLNVDWSILERIAKALDLNLQKESPTTINISTTGHQAPATYAAGGTVTISYANPPASTSEAAKKKNEVGRIAEPSPRPPSPSPAPRARKKSTYRAFPRHTPYLFLAPFFTIFFIFLIYPMLQSVVLACQQTYGPKSTYWVGLANFSFLITDLTFWKALSNTLLFTLASVFVQLPVSLFLAILLNQPNFKGKDFFRLIIFSPALVGLAFAGVLFSLIFAKSKGILNMILNQLIGFDLEFPWLEKYVLVALILASLWLWVGFNMVYFLAALQNVRTDLLEAAHIDGANVWQRFWHVVLPSIMPVVGYVVLLSMIYSFQLFELPYILLGGAGSDDRGLTVVMYLYQAGFESGDLGYASAIGWVLAIILVFITFIHRSIMSKFETV